MADDTVGSPPSTEPEPEDTPVNEPDTLIWHELAAKYDVPEFGADPLPEPSFGKSSLDD